MQPGAPICKALRVLCGKPLCAFVALLFKNPCSLAGRASAVHPRLKRFRVFHREFAVNASSPLRGDD
jgi:hypothetical protein